MKMSPGIRRDVDKLGRIVIPKELRTLYHLDEDVEIVCTKDGVLLRNPQYKVVKIQKEDKKG